MLLSPDRDMTVEGTFGNILADLTCYLSRTARHDTHIREFGSDGGWRDGGARGQASLLFLVPFCQQGAQEPPVGGPKEALCCLKLSLLTGSISPRAAPSHVGYCAPFRCAVSYRINFHPCTWTRYPGRGWVAACNATPNTVLTDSPGSVLLPDTLHDAFFPFWLNVFAQDFLLCPQC